MLDLLPPELLQTIVEYVGPPFWDEYTEPERFANLSSLSLVSKRLQSFAQPLLFAVLTLQATSTDKLLYHYEHDMRCRELVSNVRFVRCDDLRNPILWADLEAAQSIIRLIALGADCLDTLVHSTPHLQSMEIFTGTTLRKLHMLWPKGTTFEHVFLPQLEELSLACDRVEPRAIPQCQVPSLRHLAITKLGAGVDDGIVSIINTLYSQLDSLTIDLRDLEQIRPQIPPFSYSNVLLDIFTGSLGSQDTQAFELHQSEIRHVRLQHSFVGAEMHDQIDLDQFIDFIACAPLSLALSTVYISPDSDATHSPLEEDARTSKSRLIKACRRRNIQVVEEKIPEVSTWDTFISPGFVRKMSSRKQ